MALKNYHRKLEKMKNILLILMMVFLLAAAGCEGSDAPAAGEVGSSPDTFTSAEQASQEESMRDSVESTSSKEGTADSSQSLLPSGEMPETKMDNSEPAEAEVSGNTQGSGRATEAAGSPETSRAVSPGKKETQTSPAPTAASEKSEAPAPSENAATADVQENQLTVTFSAEFKNAVEKGSKIAMKVAPDGVIQPPVTMKLEKGATVYDALMKSGLVVKADSSPFGVYVSAIKFLKEKDPDCGSKSGWLFSVNGVVSGTSCSNYVLKDGDIVQWHYTCDMGKDLQ